MEDRATEEQRLARQEAESRLASRSIPVTPADSDEDVAELLDTIERFENLVEQLGGDLMVNQLDSSEPEDPEFVPPRRESGEPMPRYLARVQESVARLRERRQAGPVE